MPKTDMPLLRHVIGRREAAYTGQSRANNYIVSRGIGDYTGALPLFNGKGFMAHVKMKTGSRGREDRVSVLDVGAGQAAAISRLKKDFPDIDAYGVSAFDYRRSIEDPEARQRAARVDYRIGDAQRLKAAFPEQGFDFIVSVMCFCYLADPLNALRHCYSLLNKNGMLFVDAFAVLEDNDADLLKEFWKQIGTEASVEKHPGSPEPWRGAAIMKTERRLPLPFRYMPLPHTDDAVYELDTNVLRAS